MDKTAGDCIQQRVLERILSWPGAWRMVFELRIHATQKKVYIGKGRHFYPKSNIAEFLVEAYDISVGDSILIQGPTTGSQEMVIETMMVDEKLELIKRQNLI
jgi:hypothetical protein